MPRDLPATNQCTFHHRSWATGATLEGNYKWNWPKGTTSQQPWPAKRTSKVRCGLVPPTQTTTHHGRDLRTSVLSAAQIQTFEGALFGVTKYKEYCPDFIGWWGTFVPEIHYGYMKANANWTLYVCTNPVFDSCESTSLISAFLGGWAVGVKEASIRWASEREHNMINFVRADQFNQLIFMQEDLKVMEFIISLLYATFLSGTIKWNTYFLQVIHLDMK